MPRIVIVVAALILVLHGLIHLIGLTVYLKLGDVEGLVYKTTFLGGRFNMGEQGTRVFGALWIVPAIAFVLAALGLYVSAHWWQPMLLAATIVSLSLTLLDWDVAFMGAMVDVLILAGVWFAPRVAAQF
jgi:hypothetical protein